MSLKRILYKAVGARNEHEGRMLMPLFMVSLVIIFILTVLVFSD